MFCLNISFSFLYIIITYTHNNINVNSEVNSVCSLYNTLLCNYVLKYVRILLKTNSITEYFVTSF